MDKLKAVIKNLMADYFIYIRYLSYCMTPLYAIFGLSSILRQIILGSDASRLEQVQLVDGQKIDGLIKQFELLRRVALEHEKKIDSIVQVLSRDD